MGPPTPVGISGAGAAGDEVGGASAGGSIGQSGDGGYGEGGAFGMDDAGEGGVANDECDSGNGCILEYGREITALTADEKTFYWVEHGTSDALGNYENDGRLMSRDFATDTARTVAKGLAGPVGIGLTSTHFFVYLDQSFDASGYTALARIPRAGGAAEIVQRGVAPTNSFGEPCPDCFVHSGSTALFPVVGGVAKLAVDATEVAFFAGPGALSLTTVGDSLYFEGTADRTLGSQVYGGLASGHGAVQIAPTAREYLQASGPYLYGLELAAKSYLTRMPVAGGQWTRLPPAREGAGDRLIIAGGFFFYGLERYGTSYDVIQGSLSDAAKSSAVLTVPRKQNVKAWIGTPVGLLWSDGHSIRQRFTP